MGIADENMSCDKASLSGTITQTNDLLGNYNKKTA
jgi:hypothetical protein